MSWIDFHAPAAPATCTLTILVSDLGNNGMPLLGEIPNFAFDFDSVVFNVVDPDAPPDTPVDTPPDTPVDTPPDTPADTPPDTPVDTPPDTPVDTPPDTPVDTPPDDPTGGPRRQPSLGVVIATECIDADGLHVATLSATNSSPYTFVSSTALGDIAPGATNLQSAQFTGSIDFTVDGYFDVDADATQDAADVAFVGHLYRDGNRQLRHDHHGTGAARR